MNFINAIRNVSEIAECLKNGLQAFERQDRKKIKVNSSRALKGSVYIDKCLERRYPNEHRFYRNPILCRRKIGGWILFMRNYLPTIIVTPKHIRKITATICSRLDVFLIRLS